MAARRHFLLQYCVNLHSAHCTTGETPWVSAQHCPHKDVSALAIATWRHAEASDTVTGPANGRDDTSALTGDNQCFAAAMTAVVAASTSSGVFWYRCGVHSKHQTQTRRAMAKLRVRVSCCLHNKQHQSYPEPADHRQAKVKRVRIQGFEQARAAIQ